MLTASVILAVLATNLLELSRLQGDGIVLPPYELSATVTHIIPTMQQVQGDRVLELAWPTVPEATASSSCPARPPGR